jgi:2-oxoisovalerate dehydrogenase E2 component (dihydrolipoyl transacylase)
MGRYIIKVPDIGEGMTEAEIVAWHVKPGQVIREEDPLVDVMTDKATVELPAPVAGTVLAIHGNPGERRPVGSELIVLDVLGEGNAAAAVPKAASTKSDISPALPLTPTLSPQAGRGGEAGRFRGQTQSDASGEEEADRPHTVPLPARGERERPAPPGSAQSAARGQAPAWEGEGRPSPASAAPVSTARRPGAKPLASPAVRRRAWDLGVELQFVPGIGPGGRITQQDLDAYIASRSGAAPVVTGGPARRDGIEDVPIIGLRRAIAEHLQKSKRQIPHFSYIEEVDVTALEELRGALNEMYPEREHLTLLPFLIRALVNAAVARPQVNARYDDEAGVLHRYAAVHLGIATQTDGGLLVPVMRHAEALDVWQSAAEMRRLAAASRAGKAPRGELTGSTVTITSLGALGGLAATPVINHPEVAIVGVNRIAERPVVHQGQIAIRKMMNLSSSFDHRIVDGWEAASFIQHIKRQLEHPAMLFVG